ncbi:MAG: HAMP domain-containing sensor histidine kinase [Candidatus Paceibacterota bacterium]
MFSFLVESFISGLKRLRNNPQLTYTILLAVVIVGSFLYIGYTFIGVAQDAQGRLSDARTGVLHDTFVAFAGEYLNEPLILEDRIQQIAEQNPVIQEFQVAIFDDGRQSAPRIIAALDESQVGQIDDRPDLYRHAYADLSYTFPIQESGGRHFLTIRGITDPSGNLAGALITREELSEADQAINERIQSSTIVLISLLVLILALFLRHSHIIDYAELYKKLKELDKMKDEFISMASHELRTPLTHIRGYVDMLQDEDLTDETRETLKHIDSQALELDRLVADMLDVKRLEQGRIKFDLKEVTPDRVIEEVVEDSQRSAEVKGLNLGTNIKDTGRIYIDPSRLKQVLVNLVGNSVKYTDKGSIMVKQERKGDEIEIRVHDTGQGMSAEEQKQLFGKFSRVGSKDQQRNIKGTGLGLWITKTIVEQMGGSISAESIEGVGSDFIVRFPIADSSNEPQQQK